MLSRATLHDEWAAHPLGKNRARGGRVSLGGFLYQLYLTLDKFFSEVLAGNTNAQFSFEGLSDLAEFDGDLIYLTQVKSTLDSRSIRSAVEEALSVGQFLAEQHPELIRRVRFQIAARRVKQSSILLCTLTENELGLDAEQSRIWSTIRDQFLPVEICGTSRIDLAIRLWPHATQCFMMVEACLGRLFHMLGENRSSTEIVAALLEIWDRARAQEQPPCYLLGPRDLRPPRLSLLVSYTVSDQGPMT